MAHATQVVLVNAHTPDIQGEEEDGGYGGPRNIAAQVVHLRSGQVRRQWPAKDLWRMPGSRL